MSRSPTSCGSASPIASTASSSASTASAPQAPTRRSASGPPQARAAPPFNSLAASLEIAVKYYRLCVCDAHYRSPRPPMRIGNMIRTSRLSLLAALLVPLLWALPAPVRADDSVDGHDEEGARYYKDKQYESAIK